jgi:hypothetical protein
MKQVAKDVAHVRLIRLMNREFEKALIKNHAPLLIVFLPN